MSDSAKYPGLCKPYEVEQNAGHEYAELAFNSINAQQNPSTYYTYKTYNTNYDNERMVGTSSSTRNNVQSSFPARPSYSSGASNNQLRSYNKRFDSRTANQQQYSNQASYQPNSQFKPPAKQQPQAKPSPAPTQPPPPPSPPPQPQPQPQAQAPGRYPASPFQQAFTAYQQQQVQRRPIDRANPFHTYRWDLLFKNYL